ncbi:MAG: respiratory nitrate reductase subunit gamma [Rhodanobacter sp.]|nr:MAG: respiratory nitrate reductase subunit gamma [Rhodanobacter sp.]TAM05791.1 MAG: respiratory nitrate reductase subunit gamma [Rhodanobacter sp.]TAM41562.1 MAG: respiratory nitrate reductase subunit gamma [Rhodanobacter sp.]TAN28331.1 MAG: respiratory nitrate reductase subunit gamma [Rhodanobacter sp.]
MSIPRLDWFLFDIYPYICLSVLLLGSLVRFDREPYSWKSDSSQTLRKQQLRMGSNLFHYGVLIVILGHFVGFLMPEALVHLLMSPTEHMLLAMVIGGLAGVVALIGISILIFRRLYYARVRSNSRKWDITIVIMLWLQLALGIATVPISAQHLAGAEFDRLVAYVQSIVYFQGGGTVLLQGISWVYKTHILLGFTIFLVSPFTRMVHIWSGVGSLAYLVRPYQLTRKDTRAANPMK